MSAPRRLVVKDLDRFRTNFNIAGMKSDEQLEEEMKSDEQFADEIKSDEQLEEDMMG